MPEDQLAAAQGRLPSQISRRAATPLKTENHEMRERDLSAARTLPSLEQKLIQSAERAAALEADRTQLTPMPPTLGRAARAKAATSPSYSRLPSCSSHLPSCSSPDRDRTRCNSSRKGGEISSAAVFVPLFSHQLQQFPESYSGSLGQGKGNRKQGNWSSTQAK